MALGIYYKVITPLTQKEEMGEEIAIIGWNWKLEMQIFCNAPDPELCMELGSVGAHINLICKLDCLMRMFSFKNLELMPGHMPQ